MTDLDDHTFLVELIRQRDTATNHSHPTNGKSVAQALGHPEVDTQPIVRRLLARGYVEKSDRIGSLADNVARWDLKVTQAGYTKAGA